MKKFLKYFVAVILIIFFVFSIVPKELQNDTFYIVKLGEQIRASGLDRIDHYSWHKNLEYRYPHWLFDVVLSRIYDLFSWAGIYGFTCIMASITIVFIFFRMIKKDLKEIINIY